MSFGIFLRLLSYRAWALGSPNPSKLPETQAAPNRLTVQSFKIRRTSTAMPSRGLDNERRALGNVVIVLLVI